MNQIKISVIMPVYKVEKYVSKAIESILGQTLKEFEFIIVDDGTPDRSGEICDTFAEQDCRIKVIHKQNEGAPSARNVAINMASGKYLYFLDSDDWAEPNMLEDMYNLAEKTQAQLVVSGFFIDTYYTSDKYITTDYIPNEAIYFSKEDFRKASYLLFDKNMLYQPWNKLFLRSYIEDNSLRFPSTFWDDFPFILSVIKDIERVAVSSKQYYHFLRARAESETAKYIPNMYDKREEEDGWMVALYQYWNVVDAESQEMVARRYIERLIGCIENLTNPNCTMIMADKRRFLKDMIQKPRVNDTLYLARPRSFHMRLMLIPVKYKWVTLLLAEAKVITFVKRKFPQIFVRLKSNR